MSIERQAIRGLKWTAASKFIVQGFAWLVTLLVMRLLSPADYGLLAMAAVVVSICSTVAELGIGASIVQARTLPKDELAGVAGLAVLLHLGVGVLVAASAPLVAWAFGEPRLTLITQALSLQFVVSAVSAVPQAMMARALRFKKIAWVDLAGGLTTSGTTLALALLDQGVWSIVFGNLAGSVTRAALLLVLGENVRPTFRLGRLKSHLRYGGVVTLTRIGWDLIWQSDIVIAARFLSPGAIGVYSVALHLATLPMQKVMSVVNQVAFSALARLQDDPSRMRDGLLRSFQLATVTTVPLLWGLSSCAPEFVRVVLGPKWEAAILPLQVISVVIPLRLISSLMATGVMAIGKAELYLHTMLVGAVVFPCSFLVGVQWGLNGLAIAWPLAWLLNFSLAFRRIGGALSLNLGHIANAVRTPVLAGIPMVAMISLSRSVAADLSDIARLPLLIAVGAATYVVLVYVLQPSILQELRRVTIAARG
jgi:teichuronic acid exporter